MARPSGIVIYRGPSMLDGQPIVMILTGLNKRSRNGKTGNLFQTWIMRADMNPLRAADLGHDKSVCGGCRHRGRVVKIGRRKKNKGRSCYVRLDTAPLNIFNTWKRGRYPSVSPLEANMMIRGSLVRGGSYGDPAAVPYHVWRVLLAGLDSGTAYTHQWKHFPELAAFAMASVDTAAERLEAKALGFRTFRVRTQDEPREDRESVCPASAEAGKKTVCALCRACGGHAAKAKADIVIMAHGGAGKENMFANGQAAA